MAGTLDGKVALITGSGRGIGRAIALRFAREGARVVVNDLDPGPAEAVVTEILAAGGQAVACVGSVTATDFGERFIGTAMASYGGVDIIVNNAGYTWENVIQKITDEQWYAIIDCHLTAPFRILRAAQPVIRDLVKAETAAGRRVMRRVINISSVAGVWGTAGSANYSAAKAGIVGLTKTLAKEWGRLNTTVNAVAFGLIQTRLTVSAAQQHTEKIEGRDIKVGVNPDLLAAAEQTIPLGRGGSPDEAAGAVYMFAIPDADYVSGQLLLCTGGLTHG
ncbi:Short-chain dehydrogenase/reductase sdr [Cupriavidus necator]|uniref:Short-chain dehydrogenase/reductase sdr n=1 Tax=Cupriavidus necator TaxID=106590 RepID=A0A1K0IRY3_CUPNE|nr:Short-chain dehydrogenase/reductase sdr [Cupriavidus necator]